MVHTATPDDQTVPPVRRGEGDIKRGTKAVVVYMSVYLLLVLLHETVVTMAVLELREVAVSDLHRTKHSLTYTCRRGIPSLTS